MACISSLLFSTACMHASMGGVRAIYLALRSDIVTAVPDTDYPRDIKITAGTAKLQRYPVRGSFQSVAQVDEQTGQSYYQDELAVQLSSFAEFVEPQKVLEILQAAGPDEIVAIVELWNGKKFVMGYGRINAATSDIVDTPVFFSAGQIVSGTERGDQNGMNFTLTSAHPLPACNAVIVAGVNNNSTD